MLYNIYIQSIKDKNDRTLIGERLTERLAERRELTALSRIDRENYFIDTEEVEE